MTQIPVPVTGGRSSHLCNAAATCLVDIFGGDLNYVKSRAGNFPLVAGRRPSNKSCLKELETKHSRARAPALAQAYSTRLQPTRLPCRMCCFANAGNLFRVCSPACSRSIPKYRFQGKQKRVVSLSQLSAKRIGRY